MPRPVWVYILHMGLVCVYLHVCLSLCAWMSMCMSLLTPQVSRPYVDIPLVGGFILCVWGGGRLPPALLTSPYPRGPPGRARLCKTEARLGEAPEEWPPGDWPGLPCPRCSSHSSAPSPHSRAACPVQSPVSLHSRALTRAGATHRDVPVSLAPPPVLPPLSNGAWHLPPPSLRLLFTSLLS